MKVRIKILLYTLMLIAAFGFHVGQARANGAVTGPILYGITPNGALYKIDLMNCTACLIANFGGIATDVLVLPDGDILVNNINLRRYTLPGTTPIWSQSGAYIGSILAPSGLVYLAGTSSEVGLSIYNPANNSITYVGDWPTGVLVSEFFYQNGVLYAFAAQAVGSGSIQILLEVNTTNPEQSTIIYTGLPLGVAGGVTNDGYTSAFQTINSDKIYQYNATTNTFNFICDLDAFLPGSTGFSGLSDLPPNVPEEPCQCNTFAGTVNNQSFDICIPGSVTVPYNNNAVLGTGDILRYILFSDQSDTLGSIIVQSSSATIPFNPVTMQTGVTYYLATIAGDELGGNVDLSDSCLDISNIAARVVWRPLPTVAFSVANPDVCPGGCTNITAAFTGTSPFTLTYTAPGLGPVTQTFPGNTGTFQVCVPANGPLGGFLVAATSLTDGFCSCQ
ncbi:MAG: hypothetical protein SFV52_11620 [Saprospiraceae bacterium]|nr:hypothetical protein [Saprospiraceae bacterium]